MRRSETPTQFQRMNQPLRTATPEQVMISLGSSQIPTSFETGRVVFSYAREHPKCNDLQAPASYIFTPELPASLCRTAPGGRICKVVAHGLNGPNAVSSGQDAGRPRTLV